MSRHRNVRSMNYSEEYEGYDDVYGHSVEDDYTISPSDAAQFMYDRTNKPQMSAFFSEDDIAEEDENVEVSSQKKSSESDANKIQGLSEEDRVRLQSCLDEVRNVIGDSIPESVVVKKILAFDFDVNKTLDAVLTEATADAEAKTSSGSEDVRTVDSTPQTDKDDKTSSLLNLEEDLKRFHLTRSVQRLDASSRRLLGEGGSVNLEPIPVSARNSVSTTMSDVEPGELTCVGAKSKCALAPTVESNELLKSFQVSREPQNNSRVDESPQNIPSCSLRHSIEPGLSRLRATFDDPSTSLSRSDQSPLTIPSFDLEAPNVAGPSRTEGTSAGEGLDEQLRGRTSFKSHPPSTVLAQPGSLCGMRAHDVSSSLQSPRFQLPDDFSLKKRCFTANKDTGNQKPGTTKLNIPSFDMDLSAEPHANISTNSETGFGLASLSVGLKAPKFPDPKPKESKPTSPKRPIESLYISTNENDSPHGDAVFTPKQTCKIPRFDSEDAPDLGFRGLSIQEPLSLSALAAQHQNSLKSSSEHTSLSSLAAAHLRSTAQRDFQLPASSKSTPQSPGSRFLIPRLTSPPASNSDPPLDAGTPPNLRPSSADSHGESPIDQNASDLIDLLSALNPPDNRTKLEHPRSSWMEPEDEEEVIDWTPDPTCLLDCVSEDTPMDTCDAPLMTEESSPVGRVICGRFSTKCLITLQVVAPYEGKVKRFAFDSPSPDDSILIRLGRMLPS